MKDIDFDELDRAVSSMVSGSNSNNNAKPVNQNSNISRSMDGVSPKPGINLDGVINRSVSPNLSDNNKQRTLSLASRRSSGRFFDMVRPKSMQKTNTKPEPTVLHMIHAPVEPEAVKQTQVVESVAVENKNPIQEGQPKPEVNSGVSNDNQNIQVKVIKKANILNLQQGTSKPERSSIFSNNFIKRPTIVDSSELPESPFLTDAKVDKRPLGAFSDGTVQPVVGSMQSVSDAAVESSKVDAPVAVNKMEYPVELSNDLLQIESNNAQNGPIQTQPQPAATQPAKTPQNNTTVQAAATANTDDQNATSIYDTSNYQKTISHPAKQKNGWMWVVWIAVLVVIGGGAGAAVYFLFY